MAAMLRSPGDLPKPGPPTSKIRTMPTSETNWDCIMPWTASLPRRHGGVSHEVAKIEDYNAYHCLHAALLADELRQPELRDELLRDAHTRGTRAGGYLVEIVRAFQNCLAAGSAQLDLKTIDWAIRRSSLGNPTNEFYFVGKFLAAHGAG